MAIIKCKECGNEFSSSARACPQCGKRRTSFVTKLVLGFFMLVGVVTIWGFIQGEKASEESAAIEADRRAAMLPEERAAEDAIKAKVDLQAAVRGSCLIALRESLHDPKSAEIGSSLGWYIEERRDGTYLVQPSARAKNAFGAYVNGVWDCVAKPEGDNIRIISLKQVRP